MIRHVFLWRVAPTADPAKVLALLSELPSTFRHPQLRARQVPRRPRQPVLRLGLWPQLRV